MSDWSVASLVFPNSTSCTEAAVDSFRAGGFEPHYFSKIPLLRPLLFTLPYELNLEMSIRSRIEGSGVRKLNPDQYWGEK